MRPTHKPEYTENEKLIWDRKVLAIVWCVIAGFVIDVFLLTLGLYVFG